jgi:hypothetical protein
MMLAHANRDAYIGSQKLTSLIEEVKSCEASL